MRFFKSVNPPTADPATPPSDSSDQANHKDAAVHQETVSPLSPSTTATASKWKLSRGDGDAAMALFNDPAEVHEPHDPAEEKRLVRKIDFMILPYLAVCYAFFYIDKTTLSYAAIFGIREDLDLQGTKYNWLSSNSPSCVRQTIKSSDRLCQVYSTLDSWPGPFRRTSCSKGFRWESISASTFSCGACC